MIKLWIDIQIFCFRSKKTELTSSIRQKVVGIGISLCFSNGWKRKKDEYWIKLDVYTWFYLGLEVFWKKGENRLLNFEEFRSGRGNCFYLSALKKTRLRNFFVACIWVLQYLHEFFHDTNFALSFYTLILCLSCFITSIIIKILIAKIIISY